MEGVAKMAETIKCKRCNRELDPDSAVPVNRVDEDDVSLLCQECYERISDFELEGGDTEGFSTGDTDV